MEQIIVTRKDGTTYPLARKHEATSIKDAKQTWGLVGDEVINITIESPQPQHYAIGDSISIFGRAYKLNQLPSAQKLGTRKYIYTLTFEGVQYDLLRAYYDVSIETTGNSLQDVHGDALTGNLHRFATVLISNANRVFPGKWRLGDCPETSADKTLTFGDTDNCLAVYQSLCKTFGVEGEITQEAGVYTIHFKERVGNTLPYTFAFGKGKGLYQLSRQNVDNSNITTRLRVLGSDANLSHKYRANRLCLPGKSKGQSYIEEAEAVRRYGIHEARKVFDDIRPTFKGKITALTQGNILQFVDSSMPFDLNERESDGITTKYLIAGASAKVRFSTGNLAGYEFNLAKYDHKSKTFTINKLTDDRGDVFPSATSSAFRFAVGDEYKLLDITLPEYYVQEAEERLLSEAREYYRQNSQPKVKYGLSISKDYIRRLAGNDAQQTLFKPGDYLQVQDEELGINKAIRIQSLQRDLLDIYEYTLTLADVAEHNITTRVISELVELDKITTTHRLKDPERAKSAWRWSRDVLDMVFDPEGDYYSDKIKPNSIDTLALSVGARSMQLSLEDIIFELGHNGDKHSIKYSTGTLTHHTIEEASRSWSIPEGVATLTKADKPYYIFARCSRADNSASIVFSETNIKVEDDPNAYHFWLGVVNSLDKALDTRSLALTYGFSTINGRFISTGRIESNTGSTYFDLDEGLINGRIIITNAQGKPVLGASTIIDGGLLLSEIIGAVDPHTRALRSYIGGDHSKPAFVAGLSDDQSTSNVWIRHSGDAKFGKLYVDASGIIRFKHSEGDSEHYMRIGGGLTPLARLQSASADQGEERIRLGLSYQGRNYQGHIHETIQPAQGRIRPSLPNGRLQLQGTITLTQSDSAIDDSPEWLGRERLRDSLQGASILLYLEDETGQRRIIDSLFIEPLVGQNHHSETLRLDHSLDYTSEKSLTLTLDLIAGSTPTSSIELSSDLRLSYSARSDTKEIAFSEEGMSLFFGHDRYLYAQRTSEPFLSVRGKVEMFGVLAVGRGRANATLEYVGGVYASYLLLQSISGNRYRLTHRLGHRNYVLQLTPRDTRDTPCYYTVSEDYVEFSFRGPMDDNRSYQKDFMFTLMGEPRQI